MPNGSEEALAQPALPIWRRAPILSAYTAAIIVGGIVHLYLGANIAVVEFAVAAALLSVIPAFIFGVRDMIALITLSIGLRYASSAIAWKLLVWEPLDRGLYDPYMSFLVILCGVSAIVLVALIAHGIYRRPPLLHEHYTISGLEFLFGLGAFTALFTAVSAFATIRLLGGISSLIGVGSSLLPIAWMGYNYARGKSIFSPLFLLFVVLLTIVGIGGNSRQAVLEPITAIGAFILCFRIRVSWITAIAGVVAAVVFIGVLSPAMLGVRNARQFMPMSAVLSLTLQSIESGQTLERARLASEISLANGAYALHYTSGGGEVVDRLVKVEQLDILVDRAHRYGPIGTGRFWQSFTELLPSAVISDKTAARTPSYVFWVYGLVPWGMEFNATATSFGDAYAIGGFNFLFLSMAVVFGGYFLFFRLFCPVFDNSLFAAFIFAAYIHALTEQNVIDLLTVLLRSLPFELAAFWLACRIRTPIFSLSPTNVQHDAR